MRLGIRGLALASTLALSMSLPGLALADDDDDDGGDRRRITMIHIGDFHGELEPHTNTRSDNRNRDMEGGMARMKTVIDRIRDRAERRGRTHYTFLTGDVTQGAVQVAYTSGDAMLRVLNQFDIDASAPGNWDFLYGTCRSNEMWGFRTAALLDLAVLPNNGIDCLSADPPGELTANWPVLAANVYVDADDDGQSASCSPATRGERLFDTHMIIQDGDIRIGVIGFTTERGPRVVGNSVVRGLCYTKGDTAAVPPEQRFDDSPTPLDQSDDSEMFELSRTMKNEDVDVVVVLTELGLANSIRMVDSIGDAIAAGDTTLRAIDLVLSADMHEETPRPVRSRHGTLVVDASMDTENLGEVTLSFRGSDLRRIHYRRHQIEERIPENPVIAQTVEDIEAAFVAGPGFDPGLTEVVSGQSRTLDVPIDTVVGIAGEDFSRNNFSDENDVLAAVLEGSGHNLITDAFRMTVTDVLDRLESESLPGNCLLPDGFHNGNCEAYPVVGIIRGFRYATSIEAGQPIVREDLYHYIPISPFVAVGRMPCGRLRNIVKNSGVGSLSPNIRNWGGGWLFNWSGLTFDYNPYVTDSRVPAFPTRPNPPDPTPGIDRASNFEVLGEPLVPGDQCLVAGYNYDEEPDRVNKVDTFDTHRLVMGFGGLDLLDLEVNGGPFDLTNSRFSGCPLDGTCDTSASVLAVDVVAGYLDREFLSQGLPVRLQEPARRINVTCPLPDFSRVRRTSRGMVLNQQTADFPIVDVGFPLMQSLFGANPNLIQYLPGSLRRIVERYPACADVIDADVLATLGHDDDD